MARLDIGLNLDGIFQDHVDDPKEETASSEADEESKEGQIQGSVDIADVKAVFKGIKLDKGGDVQGLGLIGGWEIL